MCLAISNLSHTKKAHENNISITKLYLSSSSLIAMLMIIIMCVFFVIYDQHSSLCVAYSSDHKSRWESGQQHHNWMNWMFYTLYGLLLCHKLIYSTTSVDVICYWKIEQGIEEALKLHQAWNSISLNNQSILCRYQADRHHCIITKKKKILFKVWGW